MMIIYNYQVTSCYLVSTNTADIAIITKKRFASIKKQFVTFGNSMNTANIVIITK